MAHRTGSRKVICHSMSGEVKKGICKGQKRSLSGQLINGVTRSDTPRDLTGEKRGIGRTTGKIRTELKASCKCTRRPPKGKSLRAVTTGTRTEQVDSAEGQTRNGNDLFLNAEIAIGKLANAGNEFPLRKRQPTLEIHWQNLEMEMRATPGLSPSPPEQYYTSESARREAPSSRSEARGRPEATPDLQVGNQPPLFEGIRTGVPGRSAKRRLHCEPELGES
ncbi:hypothetical protein R1flu_019082 [Riccia fluitans]|uniref:Uncharacterized protein n=1 Tax=Riccia fluitans TaxID=41844 RepID=A0ABD1ZHN3_9MARC